MATPHVFVVGERVRLTPLLAPGNRSDEYAEILALPKDQSPTGGLLYLDSDLGHDAACGMSPQLGIEEFLRQFKSHQHNPTRIRQVFRPYTRRLWWFYTTNEIISLVKPERWVPGTHHCAGGCGDINTHASSHSIGPDGRYRCYSCRNVWNRRG